MRRVATVWNKSNFCVLFTTRIILARSAVLATPASAPRLTFVLRADTYDRRAVCAWMP